MCIFHKKDNTNQKYLKERNKWIRLTILATGIPAIILLLIGRYSTDNYLRLVGNGDIVLSLFALLISMFNDIYEVKRGDDDYLANVFVLCLALLVGQLFFYLGIKMVYINLASKIYPHDWFFWHINKEGDYFILFTELTFILFFLTIVTCIFSIKAIQGHKEKYPPD